MERLEIGFKILLKLEYRLGVNGGAVVCGGDSVSCVLYHNVFCIIIAVTIVNAAHFARYKEK